MTAKRKAQKRKPRSRTPQYFCGVDIGGTFTDCVVRDDRGRLTIAKTLSTPGDSGVGFFKAITNAAQELDLSLEQLLSCTQLLLHGTTLGTNALLERKGAKAALLTTAGHADAILIMRSVGRSAGLPIQKLHHVSRHRKPDPLIPRRLIREVHERVDWSGEILLPLQEEHARTAIQELLDEGAEAIGICFLWGFANPAHELAAKQLVKEMDPSVYVTCGHELNAKPGEYERMVAVAINSYIGPLMADYIEKIEEEAKSYGYKRSLVIMQASGGVATASEAAQTPLFTIGSGPTGGVTASKFLADLLGHKNVITSDVGGTSFDVGIIHEGQPLTTTENTINQYTYKAPQVEVLSIGSGGGSIIWVDELSKTLRVGPESAGAQPGPACYGFGGNTPTVTDADLVLGYYSPDFPLGGELTLDGKAAEAALRKIGRPLGMDAVETAAGAVKIVEFQMAELMRQMTVQRGLDPRDFVVYAYGGAGSAHAATYARELGCRKVVIPLGRTASTWSALGVQAADLLHVNEHPELHIAPFDPARLTKIFADLEKNGRDKLLRDGVKQSDITLERFAEMKFRLQIHSVEVPLPSGRITAKTLSQLENSFVEKYERLHGRGSAFTGAGMDISLLRSVARGRIRRPSISKLSGGRARARIGQRNVFWPTLGRTRRSTIYDGTKLTRGMRMDGPAVVHMPETTVVVPPDTRATVDPYGNIVLTLSS